MKINLIIKIIIITLHQSFIGIYAFIDIILPDFTIFSPIRTFLIQIFTGSKIGRSTRIRKGQYITNIRKLFIGGNCFINRGNIFDNSEIISIGDNCSIGYSNTFITTSHYKKEDIENIKNLDKTFFSSPITIGNNVWITTNCTILPGANIGDNCIIAAGSVVRGTLESNFIYGGIPAKKIKETLGFIAKKY
ncbi:acyltransferase [Candidatus Gracilibacteria bacterium]|nr:acyltransferase [Candidatus Gracilibacteria bacterium]